MAATAAQIAQLRRMVAETTATVTYSDTYLTTYIEAHPMYDERGEEPYTWDSSTTPPTKVVNLDWIATYDLNAAAADIWDEKAAEVADQFDFSADGASHSLSQKYEHYQRRAAYYRARRATRSITLIMQPHVEDLDHDVE